MCAIEVHRNCGEGQFSCIVTFASITPCFKFTHPHHTVWTETISNTISIRPNVPWDSIPPPPFLAVGFAVSLRDSGRGAGFRNTRAEPRDLVMYVSRCRQRKVCHVRESGMSYLSEFSLSRRFVRQSSTNLQAVQTAQNITQENIASKYYSF